MRGKESAEGGDKGREGIRGGEGRREEGQKGTGEGVGHLKHAAGVNWQSQAHISHGS